MSKKTEAIKKEKNKKKKILTCVLLSLAVLFIVWVIIINVKDLGLNYEVNEVNGTRVYTVEGKEFKENSEPTDMVIIIVKDAGAMVAELYPDKAPITVKNFQSLIKEGFYDGLIFHRVIENFMIQTGDPTGSGSFGSDETIKGEFAINGVNNDISHVRGVLSMARKGPSAGEEETSETMDSASSQFFIVHKDSTYLDGNYAAFGKLINGYDILDRIATVITNSSDKPMHDQIIETIRFVSE